MQRTRRRGGPVPLRFGINNVPTLPPSNAGARGYSFTHGLGMCDDRGIAE